MQAAGQGRRAAGRAAAVRPRDRQPRAAARALRGQRRHAAPNQTGQAQSRKVSMAQTTSRRSTVNGITYRWPYTPVGGGVHRRRRPGVPAAVPRRRLDPEHRALHRSRASARVADGIDAELHLPEQHVDHHRHAGLAARHLGQLLPRHRRPARPVRDDRAGAAARRHDPGEVRRRRRAR